MRSDRPLRWCYRLLIACIPASLLLVVWFPEGIVRGMVAREARFLSGIAYRLQPFFPAWPQYFGVQTLVAAMLACAALYLFGTLGAGPRPRLDRRAVFPALVIAYAAWAALGYLWSAWPYATRATVVRELPYWALCVAAYALCARPRRWLTVARVFVVSISIAALLQAGVFVGAAAISRHPELYKSILGSGATRTGALSLAEAFRKQAIFFGNPNFGCALLLTGMLACAALLVRHVRRARAGAEGAKALRWAWVAAGVLAIGVMGFVFVTANALAGWLAAVVALGVWAIALLPLGKARRWAVVGILFVAGVAAVALLASDRLWTASLRAVLSPRRTTSLRVVDWLASSELYLRRPIGGWGMGTFPATHSQFFPRLAQKIPWTATTRTTHPHSEFFRLAAEQGSVGLLLYLAMLGYAFGVSYAALRRRPLEERLVGYALWAGAMTFVVQGMFGKAPVNWAFATNFYLLLGVLASSARRPLGREAPEEEAPEAAPLRLHVPALLALAVTAALIVWAWWEWGLGAYDSMVHMYRARGAQEHLGVRGQGWANLEAFERNLAAARHRCLWPDEVLHMDYAIGWFLAERGQHERGLARLQQVQQTAPEFLDTRYLMALCYVGLDRPQEALDQLVRYLTRNPYMPDRAATPSARRRARIVSDAYSLLAALRMDLATQMLEEHVLSRLGQPGDWIVEDYPSAAEVRKLLHFYFLAGRWTRARELVEKVEAFFASAELAAPRLRVDALEEVRRVAATYRRSGQEAHHRLHEQIRERFPDAWAGQAG